MGGTKAEDEKLILCIWDEKLIFQQSWSSSPVVLSRSRSIAAKNCAEFDGFLPKLLVLFKWRFLREKYWVGNFPVGF